MTQLTSHYAIDVPKGCKIISPIEYGGRPLAPGVIKEVKFSTTLGAVDITFTDEETVVVPTWLRLTVDHDTPERRARLSFADWAVNRGNDGA